MLSIVTSYFVIYLIYYRGKGKQSAIHLFDFIADIENAPKKKMKRIAEGMVDFKSEEGIEPEVILS